MKNIFFTLFLSVSIYAQENKDYFVLLTSDPMSNPSAAMMSINTASEALNQGHNVVYFAAGDGVKILMKDVIRNLHTVTSHGGNTNNISKRAEKLLTEFSNNGGIIHVSEGSFLTFGVNQENSNEILIGVNDVNWSYPKQLIQVSSGADIVFSY
ncbi:MAG: DsrE family protein [Flavobacteriales bacterium]|jgi:predicted peroxiredoxin|nr:DsrE family protein [Flavobacteriales bacterium]MDA9203907.1 DsrE family protein [Flavobacteriaceae bacterium]MDA9883140.1 DsrE family protein [Flavobacteriaceae bacterium]MDC1010391.1 DsrE family protein [Flavobacteriaceae bacterium]